MQSRADGASPFPRMMEQHRSRARSSWIPRLRACQPARMGATIPPHVLFYLRVLPPVGHQDRQLGNLQSLLARSSWFWLDPHRYRHLASLRGSRYPRGCRTVNTQAGDFGGGRGWYRPYPLRAHACAWVRRVVHVGASSFTLAATGICSRICAKCEGGGRKK
jgi:hypothetical protein